MGASNNLIGLTNFISFLLSVPILGGGIWLSNTDCTKFLQWPLIITGISIMIISLFGLVGACYRNTLLIKLYLLLMFLAKMVLLGFITFAYVVTSKGSGRVIQNRAYMEYYLQDYSGWLEERVASDSYWGKISSCIRDSKVCGKLSRTVGGVPETADMFYLRKLNPIQSGCCKPPTECGYMYENETMWKPIGGVVVGSNPECSGWSNDQQLLCYECHSCKAAVLATLYKSWRKLSKLNITVTISLGVLYVITYTTYKNNRKRCGPCACGEPTFTKELPK